MTPTDVPPAPRPRPPRDAATDRASSAPLHLWVTGRLRRRIALTDGGDEALAELTMPSSRRARRRRAGTAEDRDGVEWTMRDEGQGVTVQRDGIVHAAIRPGELQVGGHRFGLELHGHGLRSASVVGLDDAPVLEVRPDGGRRRPWAVLTPRGATPLPLPGVLAVAYTLLSAEADVEGGWGISDVFGSAVDLYS